MKQTPNSISILPKLALYSETAAAATYTGDAVPANKQAFSGLVMLTVQAAVQVDLTYKIQYQGSDDVWFDGDLVELETGDVASDAVAASVGAGETAVILHDIAQYPAGVKNVRVVVETTAGDAASKLVAHIIDRNLRATTNY